MRHVVGGSQKAAHHPTGAQPFDEEAGRGIRRGAVHPNPQSDHAERNRKVAVEQARKVLAAQQEMMTRTLAFARRQHAIVFGACAALPADEVMPLLRDRAGDTAITSELADETRSSTGCENSCIISSSRIMILMPLISSPSFLA